MAHSVILKPFQGPFAAWEKEFDLAEVRASNLFSSRHPGLDSGPCCGHNTGHVDAGNRKVQILIRGVISPLPGVISGVLVTLLSPDWRSREIRVTPLAWVSWCHHQRLILYLVKPSQIMRSFWERYRINIFSFCQYAQLNLNTSEHQTRVSCIGGDMIHWSKWENSSAPTLVHQRVLGWPAGCDWKEQWSRFGDLLVLVPTYAATNRDSTDRHQMADNLLPASSLIKILWIWSDRTNIRGIHDANKQAWKEEGQNIERMRGKGFLA